MPALKEERKGNQVPSPQPRNRGNEGLYGWRSGSDGEPTKMFNAALATSALSALVLAEDCSVSMSE